mgnify:CR=1 FL=1
MTLEVVLITGLSGSGKSIALKALEDAGYYCVDNLPPELLPAFVRLQHAHHGQRVAIAIDARSATSLPHLPKQLEQLQRLGGEGEGVQLHTLFLDANTPTLVRRFSETRRRHPLAPTDWPDGGALAQVIEHERELLSSLRECAHVIDTSNIRGPQLQNYVKAFIEAPANQLTLIFQSFGFKHGLPMDADYVFDVRMLPNPHYEPELRELTGRDAPVMAFLQQHGEVAQMQQDVAQFLQRWLQALVRNHRSYVTVAIGCTGGQHRSVYLCEQLAQQFAAQWSTLVRHRELKS